MPENEFVNQAAVPAGTRVYAVGDIHGRLDLLQALHALIERDAQAGGVDRQVMVYLGDYVDRGQDSPAIIDLLRSNPLPGFEVHRLKGNHEALMLQFLTEVIDPRKWFRNGGRETLGSYGVKIPNILEDDDVEDLAERFRHAVPPEHQQFLTELELSHREGDYFFVHAGIRPGVAIEDQDPNDLIWIRDEFLNSAEDFGVRVVHGHTISDSPVERPNRVGIDTGAFMSGRLTCAVLEGAEVRFLQS
ncbi:MAG: metallophosphoesterase family protein [Proteobacteria bacterium]|nr:metallophosphoesterase family protein [Pseudomonadota bacterium]